MRKVIDLSEFIGIPSIGEIERGIKERFIKRRKERKLSRAKLAKISGVSYGSIRRFEETGQISLASLLDLSNVIDCLPDFKHLFETPYIENLKDYKDE